MLVMHLMTVYVLLQSSELLSTFLAKVKGHSELDTALLYVSTIIVVVTLNHV